MNSDLEQATATSSGTRAEPVLLSIGLPVFNGENYLATALGSLLDQRFRNFELIISDNASSDRTAEICRTFAQADSRIRYLRQDRNIGAAANYNATLDQARGQYFKWAAHDDICKRDFLARCIQVLEENPDVVLCHSASAAIDERGRVIGQYPDEPSAIQASPARRFATMMLVPHYCIPVFGVMRRSVLEKTIRHGDWVGADRNLLAELALHGKLMLLPETLFQRRHHDESSITRFRDERERAAWFVEQSGSGANSRKIRPTWRRLLEYFRATSNAPLSLADRWRCRMRLLSWIAGRHHTGRRNMALLWGELFQRG